MRSFTENRAMVEAIYHLVDGALTLREELKLLITSPIFSIDPSAVKNSTWIMMPTGSWESRQYTNHKFHISFPMQQHCPSCLFYSLLVLAKFKTIKTLEITIKRDHSAL